MGRARAAAAARLASPAMVRRLAIRFASSLAGAAAGMLLSAALLAGVSVDATALVEATLVFWLVHLVVQLLALRVLVRQPSVALAGLLALASTIVSLVIVNAIVSGLYIHGLQTYVLMALILWATTAAADTMGRRGTRARRRR
jgi:hypothetical protein